VYSLVAEQHSLLPTQRSCARTTAGSRPPLLILCSPVAEHCAILTAGRSVTEPRRADERRSCERAFAYRKNRHFIGERTPCNQERGALAPRGFTTATAPAFVSAPMAVSPRLCGSVPESAFPEPRRAHERRSWLCIRSSLNSIRFSRHSDRMTEPRRANERRSCERAFAYRKNRLFLGERTPCNQERGRQPPVGSLPRLHRRS
jgi:hypothetical protein